MTGNPTAATPHAAKRLARLAAVQALYQNKFEQETVAQIIGAMIAQNFSSLRDDSDSEHGGSIEGAPDAVLFSAIVKGVAANLESLDAMVAGALDARFSAARLELLLRTILRAGAFELHHHATIPQGIIINDYVDVARAFFNGKEPGLINGILDKMAGKLRAA